VPSSATPRDGAGDRRLRWPIRVAASAGLFLLLACSEARVRLGDGVTGGAAGSGGNAASAGAESGGNAGSTGGATGGAASEGGAGASSGEGGTFERPFGEPVEIGDPVPDAPSVGKYDDPSVTQDLLQLFFNVDFPKEKDASEDIWVVTRASRDEPWGRAEPVTELNTSARETGIAISPDGLTIWFSSDRDGDGLDVYVSTRESADPSARSPWSEPVRVTSLSTDDDDLVSGISVDQLTLTLARREGPGKDYDIYISTRSSLDAEWSPAVPLDALNTDGKDGDASVVGADGLTLVYTQGPDGGHGDLFMARRPSLDAPFNADDVTALDELNTEYDERDAWVSPDLDYIIFSSNRRDGTEDSYQLYEAYR
jgi:hypothetical protein